MEALRCRQQFGMGSTFCYRKQIENGLALVMPKELATKCAIRKILRSIITLLKINLFESALLGWLLKNNKYDLDSIALAYNSLLDDIYDRKVFQFILMRAYYVKTYLSQDKIGGEIQTQILTIIPQFPHVYKKWTPEKSLKNLTHCEINKIFEQWTSIEPQKKQVDYNNLVDKILFLSKTYNVGNAEQNKDKEIKKKRKGNQKQQEKQKRIKRVNQKDNQSERLLQSRPSSSRSKKIKNSGKGYLESAGKKTLKDPWQDIYKDEAIPQMGLRRSSRNLFRSYANQMNESRNMFASNNSFRLFGSIMGGNQNAGLLQLKATNSFDQLKQSPPK